MNYDEQLKDDRWLALRDLIIDRDWKMCQQCMSGKNLQVHHKYYEAGKMAWEYPDSALITLCKKCHALEHGIIEADYRCMGQSRPVKSIRQVMIDFIKEMQNRF